MMEVTLYRPDDGEETLELLAETRDFLMDSRVSSVAAIRLSGEGSSPERSDSENALHVWRKLIPTETTEWLVFRLSYGWTEAEVRSITDLLCEMTAEFLEISRDPDVLPGTRESLRRQAERLHSLRYRWYEVCK